MIPVATVTLVLYNGEGWTGRVELRELVAPESEHLARHLKAVEGGVRHERCHIMPACEPDSDVGNTPTPTSLSSPASVLCCAALVDATPGRCDLGPHS